ncbi:unnamed protein product [Dovyalis caffra]|uniref:Uncharacterized protein n=1 Tax=Dovyalis caffra TaxID=77055 RepID=A0AAV1QXC1_9ROSI|nr:unnamed protein product [Dovyalis caffra]
MVITPAAASRLRQENGNEVTHYRPNPTVDPRSSFNGASEGLRVDEPMLVQPISPNSTPNGLDCMEIGDARQGSPMLVSKLLNPRVGIRRKLQYQVRDMMKKAASAAETIEHNRSIGGTHEVPDEEETDIRATTRNSSC